MAKTDVYSWRVRPSTKEGLEQAARERGASVAAVLDEIVEDWLARRPAQGGEDEEQRRLHRAASRFVGMIEGGEPDRAERARELVRERLRRRHGGA